jgi:hypothetical protein
MTATSADATEVPPYEVRCVELMAAGGDGHQHVVAIGTTDPDGGETRWQLADVLSALRDGEQFITAPSAYDAPAELSPARCPICSEPSVRTDPPEALGGVRHC